MKKIKFLLLSFCFAITVKAQEKPNIVFIEVDDLTAKYLGCFGASFAKTPNVDKLASEGVVFNNAVAQGTMCGPSRNSLISALYPHNMGFYVNGQLHNLPKNGWRLPKALQQLGYHTEWVGKNHTKPNKQGITGATKVEIMEKAMKEQMGLDYVKESVGRVVAQKMAKKVFSKGEQWTVGEDAYADFLYEKGLLDKFYKEGGKVPTTLDGDTEYMDGYFSTVALDRMKNYQENKPFFLWLNYSCPHGPYDIPKKWLEMFNPKDMPKPIEASSEKFVVPAGLKPHKSKLTTVEAIQKERAEYSAAIAYMDNQVGRIVSFIKNSPKFKDNTMIVFFSDQGIMIGDHGLEHKSTLFHDVLNPSLIVSYPKSYQAKRVNEPVELLDLCKTMVDIAGGTAEDLKKVPNGSSLKPLLTGVGKFDGGPAAFSEIEGFRSAYTGDYKYIQSDINQDILFDYKKDAIETNNFKDSNAKKSAELQNEVKKWIQVSGEIKAPTSPGKDDTGEGGGGGHGDGAAKPQAGAPAKDKAAKAAKKAKKAAKAAKQTSEE